MTSCPGLGDATDLDVQLLCGGGLAATKQFLSSQPGAAAAAALSFLVQCEYVGDFQDFSPALHLTRYREYFGASADDAT
jgi:hypothetical protein